MISILLAASLFAGETSALGWDGLGWGRSPEELLAARPGTARVVKDANQDVLRREYLARDEAEWNGIPVEVRYHFTKNSRQLVLVKLIPRDAAKCPDLEARSLEKLGQVPPLEQKMSRLLGGTLIKHESSYRWDLPQQQSKALFFSLDYGSQPICHLIFERR
ncbi:MAG: hypothetical protein ABIR87_03185 [Sphingomicrobium sp.]